MRYHEILRFQMELKQLAKKYETIGLDGDELLGAAQEELTNLRDGVEVSPEEQAERAKDYQRAYDERSK